MTSKVQVTSTQLSKAVELGMAHGRSKATWAFDGNTARGVYQKCLDLDEEGDPAWHDLFGAPSPLSGEWADDPTVADVLAELGGDDDDLLTKYEQAYYEAYHDAVIAAARYQVGE